MNLLDNIAANRKLHDRVNFRGLKISVENRKGSVREGVNRKGKKWQTFIRTPYGYLRGTVGVDGDYVDVFVGPNLDAPNVYVVHTQDPASGKYDEDKCMLGFMDADRAKQAFFGNYDNPKFFGSMSTIPFEQFRADVLSGEMKNKKIEAYGTSEGVRKEWDERGRGRISWKQTATGGWLSSDGKWKIRGPIMGKPMYWIYDAVHHNRYSPTGKYDDSVSFTSLKGAKKFVEGLSLKASAGFSVGDQVVVDGIKYRFVVKGFRGKLLLLEKKGQFNEMQPQTIMRTARQVTKI